MNSWAYLGSLMNKAQFQLGVHKNILDLQFFLVFEYRKDSTNFWHIKRYFDYQNWVVWPSKPKRIKGLEFFYTCHTLEWIYSIPSFSYFKPFFLFFRQQSVIREEDEEHHRDFYNHTPLVLSPNRLNMSCLWINSLSFHVCLYVLQ